MRVPVYPEDLLPQAAFKRLAKLIQKRWPGQSPVQLSFARETLSKGLGYANYHALMKESVNWPRDAETPVLSTTHAQLAAEFFRYWPWPTTPQYRAACLTLLSRRSR